VAVLDGGGGVDELVEEVTGAGAGKAGAGQAGGHGLGKDLLAVDRGGEVRRGVGDVDDEAGSFGGLEVGGAAAVRARRVVVLVSI